MLSSKYWITTNCIILAILAFSIFTPTLAFAAPLGGNGKDWMDVNGNSWAQNYSPQTQINKDNVQNLEVKWIFPVGSKTLAPTALQTLSISEGSTTPPIVRDGVVYIMTNYKRTYAIDAKTGKQAWAYDYTINVTATRQRLPVALTSVPHSHGFRYWESGNAILDYGIACDIYAIDAKTGKEKFRINDLCLNVPGNTNSYGTGLSYGASVGTYEKGRQFIYVLPGSMHSNLARPDSRHVTMGISMDAPYQIMWRVFSAPPQGVLVKDWALEECDIGYFRDIPCSEVAKVNRAGLEWDFARPNEPPSKWAGVTANWGQPVVDEDTGIMYTQTGNQGPYSNMSLAPGPRLYGSTIMAIDMNKGKRVWWLQPFPHDPYDYDCNWSGILLENPTLGKVYVKGCKEGIFYVMDAATGQPKYKVDVVQDQAARGQILPIATTPPPDGIRTYMPDPKSYYDMREWNWISYPATKPGEKGKYFTLPATMYPSWTNGIFGTDMSFDPKTQTLMLYEDAIVRVVTREFPSEPGRELFTTIRAEPANSTVVARDIVTGKVKWTWFYGYSAQRSAMAVSGDMVFSGFTDGYLRFFDINSGKLLKELPLGAPVTIGVTIGKDSSGDSKIFAMSGSSALIAPAYYKVADMVPGTLVAIGLSDKATTGQTTTVTTTQSTTLTTTSSTTVATTVTTSAPAQTVTATQSVTQTTGLPSEVTYAAVGVAVIALIAAAVLVMRKK
ncbi:MAG: PQQ-binding-like beta-propeller repeat protein [Thaumarchaeota archaeon]|nr:PQQ-binding-like beta-propeller repeat protein [Nitrososphaerota archaeon]